MLVIRMQRVGRKGHAQFRVVVQDSRRTPTSGKIVAALGSYNPHAKTTILDKEKASFYLEHGAQPSPRVVRLLKAEGVKLPSWVKAADKKSGTLRNPDKLRRNRPPEEAKPVEEAPVEEVARAEEPAIDEASPEEASNNEEKPAAAEEVAIADEPEATEEKPAVEESAPTEEEKSDESKESESSEEAEPEKPTKA